MEVGLIWLSYLVSVVVVAGWVWNSWRTALRRSVVQRFFGSQHVTVLMPLRLLDARRAVDEADFAAAVKLAAFLNAARVTTTFRFVAPDGAFPVEEPGIVAICGPKSSPVVARAIDGDPRLAFAPADTGRWVIADRTDGTVHASPIDTGDPDRDVGYLARLPRRAGSAHRILVIAGIHAAGSAGVVHLLTDRKQLKALHRSTKGHDFSAAIASEFRSDPFTVLEAHLEVLRTDPPT